MELTGPCVICKNITIKKCGGCEGRFICDKDHQKEDWTRGHKYTCSKLWRLVEDPNFGHLFRARKDLKEDTLLLTRKPLLVIPREIIQEEFEDLPQQKDIWLKYGVFEKKRTCLGCNRLLVPNSTLPKIDYNRCSKCSWPVCDSSCEQKLHKAECRIFETKKVSYEEFETWASEDLYFAIGHLRLLLLRGSKREKYDQILNLEIWDKKPLNHDEKGVELKKFLFKNCLIPLIHNDEFDQGLKILRSNRLPCNHRMSLETRFSFMIYEAEKGGKGMILMNSCIPIAKTFIDPLTYEMQIYTVSKIARNHMLTISYDNSWLTTKDLKPFFNRQLRNVILYYRMCGCKLCQFKDDCAYFDTPEVHYLKISGMKCQKENCNGILTIINSPEFEQMNEWNWGCSNCSEKLSIPEYYGVCKWLRKRFLDLRDSEDMNNYLDLLNEIRGKVHETNGIMHVALYMSLNLLCKLIHEDKPNLDKFFYLFEQYFRIVDPLFKNHFRSAYFKIFYALVHIRFIGKMLAAEEMDISGANEKIGEFVFTLYKSWKIIQQDPMSKTEYGEEHDVDFISQTIVKYVDGFKITIKKRIHEIEIVLPEVNYLEDLFVFRDAFNYKYPPIV